jgi:hypothetical protein
MLWSAPYPTGSLRHHRPDDGGSKHLWNVGKVLPDYTAQHSKRQPSSVSSIVDKHNKQLPDDGRSLLLWNLPDYTAKHSRRHLYTRRSENLKSHETFFLSFATVWICIGEGWFKTDVTEMGCGTVKRLETDSNSRLLWSRWTSGFYNNWVSIDLNKHFCSRKTAQTLSRSAVCILRFEVLRRCSYSGLWRRCTCSWEPTFRSDILPPSSGLKTLAITTIDSMQFV